MREGTKGALLDKEALDEGSVKRAATAAEEAPPEHRVRVGLEVLIAEAESDPAAARSALRELRADHRRLARLETWLGGEPSRMTFGLGAAMQLADTALGEPTPELGPLLPELLRWLEGAW